MPEMNAWVRLTLTGLLLLGVWFLLVLVDMDPVIGSRHRILGIISWILGPLGMVITVIGLLGVIWYVL